MSVAIVTGSAGLIGAEASRLFAAQGLDVVGIDNDLRRVFFGDDASTAWMQRRLEQEVPRYRHVEADVRDEDAMCALFREHGRAVSVIIHTAAQPSHDWAASAPRVDFTVNALGTLTLLEATRLYCPDAAFIFTSTNKVYGDRPNQLPLVEQETRWELSADHPYHPYGIDETMSIDHTLHSLFGASKVAADILVQEYGRYFGMRTVCFRAGCLTGPGHSAAQLHGFLAYLMKCAVADVPYTVFGYKGKQVRDNIHSLDLVSAFWHFAQKPRVAEVYNIGGGRASNCSMVEAIGLCERLTGRPMRVVYTETNRIGDHIWWIGDLRRFQSHYPEWSLQHGLDAIMTELHAALMDRLLPASDRR